jgi:phosphoribosylanthranilate isomerase
MRRTRVKICGLTRAEDALAAAQTGADAVGLVFYSKSPRAVDAAQARAVLAALPPFVTSVGLFVDAEPALVRAVLEAVPLDLLQFHGDESEVYCAGFGRPWIKALRVRPGLDLGREVRRYGEAGARGLLLDTYEPGRPGGTGQRFDWGLIPPALGPGIILAGGLNPENVAEAIRAVRPYGVDVSGGVEAVPVDNRLVKGRVKDRAKLDAFMHGVTDGDRSR